jgi:hypothetical protein
MLITHQPVEIFFELGDLLVILESRIILLEVLLDMPGHISDARRRGRPDQGQA